MTKLINSHNDAGRPPARALPHARLHDLRHLHATTLLPAGVPLPLATLNAKDFADFAEHDGLTLI